MAWMGRPRRSSTALPLLLLASACFPEVPPAWLVAQPRIMGIRSEVVEAGPHSRSLADDPPDRVRAEFLPGDSIRLQALLVGPDGVLEPPEDGEWFQCSGFDYLCTGVLATSDLPDCGALRRHPLEACRLGQSAEQPFQVADLDDSGWFATFNDDTRVAFIAATRPGETSENCVRRLTQRRESAEDLWDCAFGVGTARLGPRWALDAAVYGVGGYATPPPDEVPPEVAAQEPDLRPEPQVLVSIDGGSETTHASATTLELEPGQHVSARVHIEERDLQTSWFFDEDDGQFREQHEGELTLWSAASTRNLDGDADESLASFDWTVSAHDDGGTIVVAGRDADDRNEAWAWLLLRVAPQ